jgi:hypothetical protein
MGGAILKAVAEVFPNVPDFICHFHFLKDIGKDLLGHDYSTIRRHLRRYGIRGTLRKTAKALKQAIEDAPDARQSLSHYLESKQLDEPDTPLRPLAAAYLIISWVLEAKSESNGFGFPFDSSNSQCDIKFVAAAWSDHESSMSSWKQPGCLDFSGHSASEIFRTGRHGSTLWRNPMIQTIAARHRTLKKRTRASG